MPHDHDPEAAPPTRSRRSDRPRIRVTPQEVLGWTPEEADDFLELLEERVPQHPRFLDLPAVNGSEAVVFGDSHGDWRSTADPVERFLRDPTRAMLLGLGDYVDRSPSDCASGSVANALGLLSLAADHPDRVILVVGNHELVRRIPALPHELAEEVDALWGPEQERYDRLQGLLERGPLAVRTANGVYLAHAGFPRGDAPDWEERLTKASDDTLLDVTWSDCEGSGYNRGLGEPLTEREVLRFLARAQCRLFLRGHDPPLNGRSLFHGTVLTLHTTRFYERYGGDIYATFPLGRPITSARDVEIHHVSAEGKVFPEP